MMKHTIFMIVGSLLSLSAVSNATLIPRQSTPPNATQIEHAGYGLWLDGITVAGFIEHAGENAWSNNKLYQKFVTGAYNDHLDQYTQKQVLDNQLPPTTPLENANTTLATDGALQAMGDILQQLTTLQNHQQKQIQRLVTHVHRRR